MECGIMAKLLKTDTEFLLILEKIPIKEKYDHLKCGQCHLILKVPMQLIACGHRICRQCFEKIRPKCWCGTINSETFIDYAAQREISYLHCFCIFQKQGCAWEGIVTQIENHLEECELNGTCIYSRLGCHFKGSNAKISKHFNDEKRNHDFRVLLRLFQEFDSAAELLSLSRENETLFQKVMKHYQKSIKILEGLKQKLREFENLEEKIRQLHEYSFKEIDIFKRHYRVPKILQNIDKVLVEIKEKGTKIRRLIHSESHITKNEEDLEPIIIDKKKLVKTIANEIREECVNIDKRVRVESTVTHNGHVIYKIEKIHRKLLDSLKTGDDLLTLPPFYSSRYGYKLILMLKLLGEEGGQTIPEDSMQYLSVYISLLKGEFDELQSFPFARDVTIVLRNQSGKEDCKYILEEDVNIAQFQRNFTDKLKPVGFSKFMSHVDLHSEGYIRDDCIYFDILVDKRTDIQRKKTAKQIKAVNCQDESYL